MDGNRGARRRAENKFVQLGGGNLLKGLLLADPQAKVLGNATKKKTAAFVGTWRRFVLANVSPALQIALSERAAAMMARSVEISTVTASPHTLADEASLALQAQRPCWPACARSVHGNLFFRVHLQGELAKAQSYPCTLLVDVIRLVRTGRTDSGRTRDLPPDAFLLLVPPARGSACVCSRPAAAPRFACGRAASSSRNFS